MVGLYHGLLTGPRGGPVAMPSPETPRWFTSASDVELDVGHPFAQGLLRLVVPWSGVCLASGLPVTAQGAPVDGALGTAQRLGALQNLTVPLNVTPGTVMWFGRSIGVWDANTDLVRSTDFSTNQGLLLRPQWQVVVTSSGVHFPPSSASPIETWITLAGTWDGTNDRFYRNGALITSSTYTGTIAAPTTLLVGNYGSTSGTSNLTGFGMAWRRVLDPSEIAALAADPLAMLRPRRSMLIEQVDPQVLMTRSGRQIVTPSGKPISLR